jgi:transposase-like protein
MTADNASTQRLRDAALRLLANGDATVAEVATLIGTSRQLVAYWAKGDGLDPVANRRRRLTQLWLEAQVLGRPTRSTARRHRSRK